MKDLYAYRFGVNYTPTRNWYYCWNDFCPDAVSRDLDAIAALEADHIRLMLVWPYFQPNPGSVSRAHLERLGTVMKLAAERKLDVCVSLFIGWLSGYNFKPPHQRDESFYRLAESGAIQELYVREVAAVLKRHNNFLGFDLGNELNLGWPDEDLSLGDEWQKHMLGLCAELFPGCAHVNGVDHNSWFRPATFSPRRLARLQRIIPLHCWTYFSEAFTYASGDPFGGPSIQLLATMAALARAYAGDITKPIWAQEYGMSEEWMDKKDIPRFLEQATRNGIRGGVSWFTWWASHDLDKTLRFEPLEYSLGLISHGQKIKSPGLIFRDIARAYRGRRVQPENLPTLPDPPAVHTRENTWQWLNRVEKILYQIKMP